MNAGAFGGETWQWVDQIECVDRTGSLSVYKKDQIKTEYRHVSLPKNQWILSGTLTLNTVGGDFDGRGAIRSLLEKRSESQPIQTANAGSVFKNPKDNFAAQLIEENGLKGHRIGGARVSEKHANFIINDGDARSADIENLILHIQHVVKEKNGIFLEPEVRIIGRGT